MLQYPVIQAPLLVTNDTCDTAVNEPVNIPKYKSQKK